MAFPKQHRAFFIVLAFAAVLFLSDIWIYKDFVRAESYFGIGSRLMVEQGDWLTPHAPDELPLNKPPLTYWLIGSAYKLFGTNYGSARLPSVLAALLVLALVYWIGARLEGKLTGLVAMAILASSFLFLSFARMAMSDMLLTLCVTAAIACLNFAWSDHGSQSKVLPLLGYAALALGVLAKGPIAIVLVAAPIGLEVILRRTRGDLKQLRIIPGLILFGLIAAPYFVAVYARAGAGPLGFFFFGENLRRFTGQVYGASGRPVWFELLAFFSDLAPWSILIFAAIWFDWQRRARLSSGTRVLYLWLGSTILLFSVSSFKLDYYLLPAMPAAALIIAPLIAKADELPRLVRRSVKAFLVLCSLVMVIVASLSLQAIGALSISTPLRFLPVIFAVVGLGVIIINIARRKTWQTMLMLTLTMWLVFVSMQLVWSPAFGAYLPATRLAASIPEGSDIYTSWVASDWANGIAFSAPPPHRVERLIGDDGNQMLMAALRSNQKSVAVIRESEYATLVTRDPSLKILTQAETFGHGGLSLNMLRDPRRERLLLIGH